MNVADDLPSALLQREAALSQRIIATSAERPRVDNTIAERLMVRVITVLSKRLPAQTIDLLNATNIEASQHANYCPLVIALYQEILAQKPSEAALLLRSMERQ